MCQMATHYIEIQEKRNRYNMKVILFIVASVLLFILAIPMIVLSAIIDLKHFDTYLYNLAFSIDQLGNVLCSTVFNKVLIKNESTYKYGDPDNTISHVTGVNKVQGHLKPLGKLLAWILNALDKNHVEKASKNEQ